MTRREVIGIRVAVAALAGAALAAALIGWLDGAPGSYWAFAVVWSTGAVVALSIAIMAGAELVASRDRAREFVRFQSRVGDALARSSTLEQTTRVILHALAESLQVDLAVAWRVDHDDQRLRMVDLWSAPQHDVHAFRRDSEGVEFESGQGTLGEVWARGTPRMLEVKHGDFRRQELLQGLGMRTVLFVPIVNAGEVTGVIECFFAGRPPTDESLLSLVSHVGHQIGLAYDRAERAAELIESETRRRYVLGAMLRAEEEAKARLASDLHDDTIQVMVAAQLTLERISAAAHKSDLALVETATGSATETLRTAIERTRHLMFELRPQVLGEQGLTAAVNGLLEDAAKDGGFTFTIESTIGRYTRAIENLCYRVIQEAVSNVKRHAQAGTVTVTMEERNGDIACRIHDDGIGFDLERALDRDRMRLHLGLESMQERLTVSGGDLTITSSPGEGTTVCFEIPLTAAADLAT